jgi:hypothetical protein
MFGIGSTPLAALCFYFSEAQIAEAQRPLERQRLRTREEN